MSRITLYLGEELLAKVKEHNSVNWSAVAQTAFKEHLERIKPMDTSTIEGVRARILQSRENAFAEAKRLGVEAGKHWAMAEAEYMQLRALSKVAVEDFGTLISLFDWEQSEFVEEYNLEGMGPEYLDVFASAFDDGATEIWDQLNID